MVAPLFNAAYVLLEYEPSETHKLSLERVQKITFKQFMMVSRRTNTTLVDDMIRRNLRRTAQAVVATCKEQWEQRKAHKDITAELPCLAQKNGLRGVPNNWSELVNTMVRPCPGCKEKGVVTSRWHLLTKHKIYLPHVNYIWKKEILPVTLEEVEEHVEGIYGEYTRTRLRKRKEIRDIVKPIIAKHVEDYNIAWGRLLVAGITERRVAGDQMVNIMAGG
jgi:hypothetical protein